MNKGNYRRWGTGSYRLRGYDYASEGVYFITICTHDHQHFFGEVAHGSMILSPIGSIVENEWQKTPEIRQSINLKLDAYCVMPNHFHALFTIGSPVLPNYDSCLPATDAVPTQFGGLQSQTVGAIVRGFKGSCTSRIRAGGFSDFRWQKRFHDRIVRNRRAWYTIRQYILDNPRRWQKDRFYSGHS